MIMREPLLLIQPIVDTMSQQEEMFQGAMITRRSNIHDDNRDAQHH